METRLSTQRKKSDGFHGHTLAAGVRSRYDEGARVSSHFEVKRNDLFPAMTLEEDGVAGPDKFDSCPLRDLGRIAMDFYRILRFSKNEVKYRQSGECRLKLEAD